MESRAEGDRAPTAVSTKNLQHIILAIKSPWGPSTCRSAGMEADPSPDRYLLRKYHMPPHLLLHLIFETDPHKNKGIFSKGGRLSFAREERLI